MKKRLSWKLLKVVRLKPGTYTFTVGEVIPYKGSIIVVVKPRRAKR